jgi:hypothetical protein
MKQPKRKQDKQEAEKNEQYIIAASVPNHKNIIKLFAGEREAKADKVFAGFCHTSQ